MKNWTGIFCRIKTLVGPKLRGVWILTVILALLGAACASKEHKPDANTAEGGDGKEISLKDDRKTIEELRKNIPEEIRKDNDHLAAVLQRWKIVKTPPDRLRELFNDEIRKLREEIDKRQRRMREDFQRSQNDRRHEFQEKQKEERDALFASKPSTEKRSKIIDRQSEERDRFNSDIRDERDEFDDKLKDERKVFEDDIRDRWSEFRQEFPEYTKLYNEMKAAEEKAADERREQERTNPKPYGGWPYKAPGDSGVSPNAANGVGGSGMGSGMPASDGGAGSATGGAVGSGRARENNPNADVNQGGNGWPASDPSELDQLNKPQGEK